MFIFGMLAPLAATYPVLAADTGPAGAAGAAAGPVARAGTRSLRKDAPAGGSEYRMDSGGVERRYLIYLPESLDREVPAPVVFDLHGSGSDPREEMQVTGMDDAAERYGFVLLMPFAAVEMTEGGYTWNIPPDDRRLDDVQFTIDVLDHAAEQVTIDERRVYVTGFSGGARLAPEIACTFAERSYAVKSNRPVFRLRPNGKRRTGGHLGAAKIWKSSLPASEHVYLAKLRRSNPMAFGRSTIAW